MIKIFGINDTDFSTNGNIVIDPLKLVETKKKSLNGWNIDVEVPIKYNEYIKQDYLCVVKTKSKLNPQAFRINNIEKAQRKIIFTAEHVMFDSRRYFLLDVRPTNLNALNSLKYINERTDKKSPFNIVFSDSTISDTCYFIRKNLLEAWEVIDERFDGSFDADNFDISFKKNVGVDRGEIIAYGKNLQNIKIYEDWSNVCTRLYPVGKEGLLLPEKYIDSEIQYDKPYTKSENFESSLEEEQQTEDNLVKELREKAINYLKENSSPNVSYEITSDINQNLEIGDKIHVKHPLVNLLTEVQEYEYNIMSKKIKKLIFGNYTRDVKSKFDNIKKSIENVNTKLTRQQILISEQTDLINSLNKNGYVYIDDNEILILDELPKENSKNVWRFGLGGLGFSENGYKGPFKIAITSDGKINADFITAGTMSMSRIEGLQNTLNDYLININLNSTSIQQIVGTQNSIVEKFDNYTTTTDLQALISESSEEILLQVSKNYTSQTDFSTELNQAKNEAINSANSATDDKLKNYTTEDDVFLKISEVYNDITLEVRTLYATKDEFNTAVTNIKIRQDDITLEVSKKLNEDEFGTRLQISYDDVQIAWNSISKYIQFENGELRIYDSEDEIQKLRSVFNENGEHFYRDGYYVGRIGTNQWRSDHSHKGLSFDLSAQAKYITFAQEENETDDFYSVMLTFSRANSIFDEFGVHLSCDLYGHGHSLNNFSIGNISSNGYKGLSGAIPIITAIEDNGNGSISWRYSKLRVFNGIVVGYWND